MVNLRGWAAPDVWRVYHIGMSDYYAERTVDGKGEYQELNAHCLACAKTEVLQKYGGRVDLRGWHKADGMCGPMLLVTQQAVSQEEDTKIKGLEDRERLVMCHDVE